MKITELIKSGVTESGNLNRPYIVAEAGVNHEGDMNIARRLIEEATEAGADAIKFQTYKAETLASKESPAYWDTSLETTRSQYLLFKKYDSFWKNEFEELKVCCDQAGIEFISTPFDLASAAFLNDLMPVYKISSSDITNKPFIEYICDFGKPVILSTGASDLQEIGEAVNWIEKAGVDFALLHCVLSYPTKEHDANLGMIQGLMEKYPDKLVGYSDHTRPRDMKVLEIATTLGARILEKHFTHDKTLNGNDHYHAMDGEDLKALLVQIDRLIRLLGDQKKNSLPSEVEAKKNARRSLVAMRDIKKGVEISSEDLTWKRPGHGISPRYIDTVIGQVPVVDIKEDQILSWEMFQ